MKSSSLILAAALLVLAGTVWYFYARIRRFFRSVLGGMSLAEAILGGEKEAETEPKSLSGATDLYLPALQADFPQLNWAEFKAGAEKEITAYLIKQGCESILIHRTALKSYVKRGGLCEAVLVSSVQYARDGKTVQSRASVTMAYVQDADKAGYQNGVSLTCPNCGAPVKSLGNKTCPYCGGAVVEINMRVWRAVDVREG